jgi:hypothetical protein
MTADERRRAFAEAFIAQARSDWDAYRVLTRQRNIAICQPLHCLIGPFFVAALKQEYAGKDGQLGGVITRARALARQIERIIERALDGFERHTVWV